MWIYYPALIAIIAWVQVFISTICLVGKHVELQVLISLVVILFLYAMNMISAKLGGGFQRTSVVLKMIPLVLLAIAGLIWGDPVTTWTAHATKETSGTWLKAIPAVLFSFDGWIVATTICHEIKESKKNLYLALVFSPLIVLVLYIMYFVGMSAYMGPDQIIAMGASEHLAAAAKSWSAAKSAPN